MSPLRAYRAADASERAALVACLRRKVAGVASATSDERMADQLAYLRGLTEHERDELGCPTSRVVPTAAGRVWLAADDLANAMKEVA